MRVSRFTLFSHLWAIAGFCEWTRWNMTESGGSWGLLVASMALIVFPNSVLCLALFAGTQAAFAMLSANSPWNHGLFMMFMNLAILVVIGRAVARSSWNWAPAQRSSAELAAIVREFAPVLRLSLIIVYLFTWFHKLNTDFLNPEVSCAGVVLGWVNRSYRILPAAEWAVLASIWITLFVELLVPLLLCFRRTLFLGLALGAGVHLFLSQYGGLHGFAAMIYAVYFLFLPVSFTEAVAARLDEVVKGLRLARFRRLVLPLGGLVLLLFGKALGHFWGLHHLYRGLIIWDLWLLGIVVLFGGALWRARRGAPEIQLKPAWAPLALFPAVIFFNGLCPYLGLKTETSWAMYSNLRTELKPNHLLVPGTAKLFGFQKDLVRVVQSSLPALQEYAGREVGLTHFEFRRICSTAPGDFEVTYERNGVPGHLAVAEGVSSDPELTRPHPWIVGKLLRFRPVDTGEYATCRH